MNLQKILLPVLGVVVVAVGWRSAGWPGVALAAGAILMWMLLHFTRMMRVLQRSANRPVGYCDSAVMLNAKLKPKMTLLHVIAMTRSLGELRSPRDEQPEVYRWADGGGSYVDATFAEGKLVQWALTRPEPPQESAEEEKGENAALPPA